MAPSPIPLLHTYKRLPVSFVRGRGAWLWDEQGRAYLDAVAGVAVCALGHCHPAITEALREQSATLLHTSNLFEIAIQRELAERLCVLAKMEGAFFCNSGAEAVEAAIKLARLYGHSRDIATPAIVVTEGSFHGRTLAALSATGNRKIQTGFEPLVQGFRRVPFGDLEAVRALSTHAEDIVAVLVEPVLGEGGIVVPPPDYLPGLRQLCDERGWLLMLDEIQTGLCRTGRWFAHQENAIVPDVMCLAKALGNGVPIGACLARGAAAELFQPGKHGSTFGGNLLACRAALAVLDTMAAEGLAARAATLGARMLDAFRAELAEVAGVVEIRGKGLMLGIELARACQELAARALGQGLLINVTAENVIRLVPPLILTDEEADEIVAKVAALVKGF